HRSTPPTTLSSFSLSSSSSSFSHPAPTSSSLEMNWTGGQRARASKNTNGPLHRQKQYFARVRAAETSNAYAAAASSPNRNDNDQPVRKRRRPPTPEFEILRNQSSKPTIPLPALDTVVRPDTHRPSNDRIKAVKRRLLNTEDWVGAKQNIEDDKKEEGQENRDQDWMTQRRALLPVDAPVFPNDRALGHSMAQTHVLHPAPSSPATQVPTLITEASRNYGPSALKVLSQGGYMRIGKATLPSRPPASMASHPHRAGSTLPLQNTDEVSQESMLLDYEEYHAEHQDGLVSATEMEKSGDDRGEIIISNRKAGSWVQEEDPDQPPTDPTEPPISPGPTTRLTTSSIVTAESDIFAMRAQQGTSSPVAVSLIIRHREISYLDAAKSLSSPIRARPVIHTDSTEDWPSSFPTKNRDDAVHEENSLEALEQVRRVCRHDKQADPKPNDYEDTVWHKFAANTSDDDEENEFEEQSAKSKDNQAPSDSTSLVNHIDSEFNAPQRTLYPVLVPSLPMLMPSSPPIIRAPLSVSAIANANSSPHQENAGISEEREQLTVDPDDSWFNFTNTTSVLPGKTARPDEVPVLQPVAFTEAEDHAWRSFVFASNTSDIEEELLREEIAPRVSISKTGDSSSGVSAVSVAATAGSVICGRSDSSFVDGNISVTGIGGDTQESGVAVDHLRNLVSVVATAGDEPRKTTTWRPPKRFTGDCQPVGIDGNATEDIEEW
ncbi:hypothetical protein EX30DRAFT_253965, partial [Ascodesmis nigricans]